jgi:hypothetical protein
MTLYAKYNSMALAAIALGICSQVLSQRAFAYVSDMLLVPDLQETNPFSVKSTSV